jgi:hypothetical protein
VRHGYQLILGRDPWPGDVTGLEYYNQQLTSHGMRYEELLFALAQSTESKDKLRR